MSEKDINKKENITSANNEEVTVREEKSTADKSEEVKKGCGLQRVVASVFKTVARWAKRLFFGASKSLAEEYEELAKKSNVTDVEPIESPVKQMIKSFFSKPRAVIALCILVGMFGLVFIGPLFNPLDVSYIEPTQQNIKPGYTMMDVPKGLRGEVEQISSYSRFSVGLSKSGKVYVWGDAETLGYDMGEIPDEVEGKKVLHVAAGYDHALAITEDGKVYGWGQNNLGQYGEAPKNNAAASLLYEWAPKAVIDGLGSGEAVKEVTCGYQMSAIVMEDGSYYIWGNKNAGAINLTKFKKKIKDKATLGIGVEKIRFTSANAIALMEDGSVVTETEGFKYVRAEDGTLVEFDALIAEKGLVFSEIATTSSTLALLSTSGEIIVLGSIVNNEDAVPAISNGSKFVAIEGGLRHYTALTDDGQVYSWGSNEWKQATSPKTKNVSEIFIGPFQNYAIDENGNIVEKWGLKGYLMGTDGFGRCVWNRILNGGRMTMTIGAIAVIISSIIGIVIGCLSGYFGGWVDMMLMRITEIVSAIPFLPFAMILSVIVQLAGLGETMRIVMMMVILGLLSWTGLARLVRGQVLAEREKEFVTAAKAMGVKESKIAFRHILPNVISIIIVSMTLDFASCMLTESSLSYLGFGVRGKPTWGNMLTNANSSIVIQNYYWQWIFPSLFLAITTICINMIGDALRDVMDPKSSLER